MDPGVRGDTALTGSAVNQLRDLGKLRTSLSPMSLYLHLSAWVRAIILSHLAATVAS